MRARAQGLQPGFHGFHVHATGTCERRITEDNPTPFTTAGGHHNPTGTTHGEHAGDLPVLLVNEDGTAHSTTVTDRFSIRELLNGDGSAFIVHAARDNYVHIPAEGPAPTPSAIETDTLPLPTETETASPAPSPSNVERYHSHTEDVFGPDFATRATGDAGARAACGVVQR